MSKNLGMYKFENNFLDYQNNYIKRLSVDDDVANNFNILAICLSVLYIIIILMFQ